MTTENTIDAPLETKAKKTGEMESVWGKCWVPWRRFFYPGWLFYELNIRFIDYAVDIHRYFAAHHAQIAHYTGDFGVLVLDVLSIGLDFSICEAYLAAPACIILYKFFTTENLTGSKAEEKFKRWL